MRFIIELTAFATEVKLICRICKRGEEEVRGREGESEGGEVSGLSVESFGLYSCSKPGPRV